MAPQVNEVLNYLTLHIMDIRDKKISIANCFSMDYEKYIQTLQFLNNYIETLEDFIEKARRIEEKNIEPFVIIGSVVDFTDSGSHKPRSFIILAPGTSSRYDQAHDGHTTISCLSDAGRAMLFKRAGDEVAVRQGDTPLSGQIVRISYDINL